MKCPVCGSTRISKDKTKFRCKKCGYTHKNEINN